MSHASPPSATAHSAGPAAWAGALVIVALLGVATSLAVRLPVQRATDEAVGAAVGQASDPYAGDVRPEDAAQAPASARIDREALLRHLRESPRDGRGWVLLGMMDLEADRFDSAAQAFAQAVTVSTRVAADPGVWCEYADALGMAQGGSLAGRPTELIRHALGLRGSHPKALEMMGSADYEQRRFASAAAHWRNLLAQMPAETPTKDQLRAAIERAERMAATSLD